MDAATRFEKAEGSGMSATRTGRTILAVAGAVALAAAPAAAIWPQSGGGPQADGVLATTVDTSGNVYAIGEFRGAAVFGAETLNSEGLSDLFVVKYSPEGNVLWAASAGGASVDRGLALAVDDAQNVYVTGFFNGAIEFNSDPSALPSGSPVELPVFGTDEALHAGRELFVAKLTATGAWEWARQAGAGGVDEGWAISVAAGVEDPVNPIPDGVIVGGRGSGCVEFVDDAGDPAFGSCTSNALLIARLDNQGNWVWRMGAAGASQPAWISDLIADPNGQVFVAGAFREAISLPTAPPTALTFAGAAGGGQLQFQHKYEFENPSSCYDAGVIEYTTDNGANWYDILSGAGDNDPSTTAANPARFLANGYNGTVSNSFSNPLGTRSAFCHNTGGAWRLVQVDLSDFASLSIKFRFRFGADSSVPGVGWRIDDVRVVDAQGGQVFFDDLEAGPGKWTLLSQQGSSIFSLISGDAVSPTNAWVVPDPSSVQDQIIQMSRSVTIPEGEAAYFVAKISDADSPAPFWQWAAGLPTGATVGGIALAPGGLYVGGTTGDANSSFGGIVVPSIGAFLAKVTDTGSGYTWSWVRGVTGGEGTAVAATSNGDPILVGTYSGTPGFADVQIDPVDDSSATAAASLPTVVDGSEVFVARAAAAGTKWRWIQASSARPNFERAAAVVVAPDGKISVAGDFDDSAAFGEISLSSVGSTDAFVAQLESTTGEWFAVDVETWVVGEEVVPPPGEPVCLTDEVVSVPEIEVVGPGQAIPNYFFWSPPGADLGQPDPLLRRGRLYAVQPVSTAQIKWKRTCNLTDTARLVRTGTSIWPIQANGQERYCGSADAQANPGRSCTQIHISGAPVDIEPAGSNFAYSSLVSLSTGDRSTDAAVTVGGQNQAKFSATVAGYSVLLYADDPVSRDINSKPVVIQVVRTLPYDTAVMIDRGTGPEPVFTDGATCVVGTEITEPTHQEHGGRNGFVVFPRAYFDGEGPDRAYDRSTRFGQIIPVNEVPLDSDGQDVMAVAWYRKDPVRTVAWPVKSVRYDCQWPANPDLIVVASELGSEVLGQPLLDPLDFPQARIYQQSDPALAGFNPNDEHALTAPANSSSGFAAVFALRDDFTAAESGKISKPYTLLKYRRPDNNLWAFHIYRVLATGAGYSAFQYNGVAGNAVFPPYPVRLLGTCAQSDATGKPAFKDYKNQVWAKSAGTMIGEYWYPLQPGFYYDRDGNREPDSTTGDCVAWLGGPTDNPVDVRYDISWPPNVPILTVGETLLTPKRGLPDIASQAAVEVIFDEKADRMVEALEYDPTVSLVRLIDPLSPRSVRLNAIPSEVAADIETETGLLVVSGNSEGTIRLPSTIADRLRYDSLNKRLSFAGIFDESGAGEPVLLLNVLTNVERVRLKSLDGGDGSEEQEFDGDCGSLADNCSWDEAIEALYRLSRNPGQLDLDLGTDRCHLETVLDPDTGLMVPNLVCTDDTDGEVDSELLLGLQDEDADHVPEALQVVGFSPALTAGFAQGTGYVTVAFNNDITLNPLPVSLNVIRVDCLQVPPDRLTTYQGQINVIQSGNVFDESLTMRHSGDFAGDSDNIEFEWFFHPDEGGLPPTPLPDPDNGQLNGWLQFTNVPDPVGAIDITIEGANIQTLSDNWFVVRYRYVDPPIDVGADGLPGTGDDAPLCGGTWSVYAGQPGATPLDERAQLAEGWVKRVVRGLNPFEARVQDFHAAETNTYASMIYQIGERYEGDIAFNPDAGNLNAIGLIEAYTTVFNRAKRLSIDGTPPVDYAPINSALLLVASRISDFYALLGNEAYADAQDPMIGYGTGSDIYGTLAPTIFAFQNQLDSLLLEELVLLRGRDTTNTNTSARPVYNRLYWNFTSGDGEFAYALAYNITDQNLDGTVNEFDARVLFPQGHGDAWGHYLTGLDIYYGLLRHPFFTWLPRPEAVLVAGVPIQVDYLDERKFAKNAAMKARVGAEIVNLTYRDAYVEDPAGQWQGYKDTDVDRAWGLSEWGKRAGQGAYFDWVVGNAILPSEDPNPAHVGIQRVDRIRVQELHEIATQFTAIQLRLDEADRGLNPLGLAKGVVPFDIDPALLNPAIPSQRQTHFEQVYDRAMKAMSNAVETFNHANLLTELIRRTQDSTEAIYSNNYDQEIDFKNRLIEIFGYPYDADLGPAGTYPSDYDGPDIYHYMYVDQTDLTGAEGAEFQVFTATFKPMQTGIGFFDFEPRSAVCTHAIDPDDCAMDDAPDTTLDVDYHTPVTTRTATAGGPDTADSFFLVKPASWGDSQRRAPGDLQGKLSALMTAMNSYQQILTEYNNFVSDVEDAADLLETQYDVKSDEIAILNGARQELSLLTGFIETIRAANIVLRRISEGLNYTFKTTAQCLPQSTIVGLAGGGDLTSTGRCAIELSGSTAAFVLDTVADGLEIAQNAMEAAKEDVEKQAEIEIAIDGANFEILQAAKELEKLVREEPLKRLEAYARREAVEAARGDYLITLTKGQRTLSELAQFRANSAADIQTYRYRDMAFRIFRNDALQKYRAQFDLAARYAYLAATAYDYETNLLGSDNAAGRGFLTSIVKERALGQLINGVPVSGSRGLAGPLGQMRQNFDVLKSQLGFTNPQVETNRFSLRREAFRLLDDSDQEWRDKLENEFRVDDLWNVPEFRRYARPFAPESAGPQPGLVIPFETTVTFGLNFFGWPLGPGDSFYDSSHFSTRVNTVGTWFVDYTGLPLANTPRVYLLPVGADVLRSPSDDTFATREWQVVDQALPIPFPLAQSDLDDPAWIPANDTLSDPFTAIRRIGAFRAYASDGSTAVNLAETTYDSRLVGRSVWNRKWLLVIPGGTLLSDPQAGLDTFIHGQLVPGGGGERDGNGVSDIQLFFSTYAYTGN